MKNLSLPANIEPQQLSILLELANTPTTPVGLAHPVYNWLIQSRLYGSSIRQLINQHLNIDPAHAVWCFNRMGQSCTTLADGTEIYIAGEHEDYYDPDFRIYNDVVIIYPDQTIKLLQYPHQDFPPTDFHTASLDAEQQHIILVGSMGHPERRDLQTTQVAIFNLLTTQIKLIKTTGHAPSWLNQHEVIWIDNDVLEVSAGHVLLTVPEVDYPLFIRNLYRWQLNTINWQWHKPEQSEYQHWYLCRQDQGNLCLFDMSCLIRDHQHHKEAISQAEQHLISKLGFLPSIEVYQALYQPDYPHQSGHVDPDKKVEYNEYYIQVAGVQILYIEEFNHIQMIAEHAIDPALMQQLVVDLKVKLEALHATPILVVDLQLK